MSRTALSALEHYRNKTHDCSWWLLGAEQTMTSPRLCHGKSRRPLQPFKSYFGTWARSHSCIPVGCSPGWGKEGQQEPAGSRLSLAALQWGEERAAAEGETGKTEY